MATPSLKTCPCLIKKPKICRKCGPGACTGKAEFTFNMSYFIKSSFGNEWESFAGTISGKWNGTVSFISLAGQGSQVVYSIPNQLVQQCTRARNFQTSYMPGPDDPLPCGVTVPGERITITSENEGCGGFESCRNSGPLSYIQIIPYQISEIFIFYYSVIVDLDNNINSGAFIQWDFWATGGGVEGSSALNVTITNPYSPPLVTKWYVNGGSVAGWPIKILNGSIDITIPDEI